MDAPSLAVEIRCVSFWEAQGVPQPAVSLPTATMAELANMAQSTVLWPPQLGFSVTLLDDTKRRKSIKKHKVSKKLKRH